MAYTKPIELRSMDSRGRLSLHERTAALCKKLHIDTGQLSRYSFGDDAGGWGRPCASYIPRNVNPATSIRKILMKKRAVLPNNSGRRNAVSFLMVGAISLALSLPASAQLTRISVDNLTNTDSVHKTEVEPDSFAWGNTIVSAFHVARRPGSIGWGSGDVGFSTSTDGGVTWKFGDLPGLTVNYKSGTYGAAADPSVAYDAKHGQWLISTLPLARLNSNSGVIGDVAVKPLHEWIELGTPIIIDKTHLDDKNWSVCDNTPTSPYYGNCYTEWDQAYGSGDVLMSVSSDGGMTWGKGLPSSDHAGGLGGEPVVQPNGTVIVPFQGGGIDVFSSTNGRVSWGKSQQIATIDSHLDAGGIRNPKTCHRQRSMAPAKYLWLGRIAAFARGARTTTS